MEHGGVSLIMARTRVRVRQKPLRTFGGPGTGWAFRNVPNFRELVGCQDYSYGNDAGPSLYFPAARSKMYLVPGNVSEPPGMYLSWTDKWGDDSETAINTTIQVRDWCELAYIIAWRSVLVLRDQYMNTHFLPFSNPAMWPAPYRARRMMSAMRILKKRKIP